MPPRRRVDRALYALGALVVLSTAARFALSRGVDAPWIAPDEQLYGLLGRSLVGGDGLTLLGDPVAYYSFLYPLLVGLPFVWTNLEDGVRTVQFLQALLMSLTAVPVFLWTRPLAGSRWALVAASLTLLIPGLAYSGLLMSEALYYLVATVAVWALAACLTRPTLGRQLWLLGAVAVAFATRLQAVGLAGTIVLALALLAVAERSLAPFRRLFVTLAILGLGGAVWIMLRVRAGGVGELLGAYAPLTEAGKYSVGDIAQSVLWETGAVALVTVGVPLVGLGILAWETLKGAESEAGVRSLVASALAYAIVTLVLVGAFASRFVEHVTERQLLSVAPPLFVAFAVWLRRGAPSPQPATSVVAFVVAATALLLPLDRVTAPAIYADSPSLIPLELISRHLDKSAFEGLYAGVLALLLLAAVLLPRRAVPALAVVVALALGGASLVASREIRERSQVERARTFAAWPVDWVDAAGERDVGLIVTDQRLWPSTWELLFWNETIRTVVRLRGAESPGIVPQQVVTIRPDGRLETRSGTDPNPTAVAAPSGISIVGDELATLPASFEQEGMVLWHVEPPLRVSRRIVGLKPNGDLYGGSTARVVVFGCRPGELHLTLLGKGGKPTRIRSNGRTLAERAIAPGAVWHAAVPAPAHADGTGRCVYELATDGLVGSTLIDFVPDA